MARPVVVHAHFYQPPRENPWTGEIDEQPGAAPFHDWNERIHAECYEPNVAARIPGTGGAETTVNNLERISFDVGPTLMSWLHEHHPDTHERIVAADRASIARLGVGNAMAQAYHHSILPLAHPRDVRTEIAWGIGDFEYRFGRRPEGLWLPETAADDATLALVVDAGIEYTVLAPHQGTGWRSPGGRWHRVDDQHPLDTRRPYRWEHPEGSGRSLALFFYDGDIAKRIAFENAGASAEGFVALYARHGDDPRAVVHAATDGETYGHHHTFSDLGLAYALFIEFERAGMVPINYGAALRDAPPELEVRLASRASSWSCAHGAERWRADCGCSTGGEPGWHQRWRAPLRTGLELVRDAANDVFDRVGGRLFHDPWAARDDYIEVVLGADPVDFLGPRLLGPTDESGYGTALALLELQRHTLAMFTSCGWFFNDVGGIESVQVLRYARRALELLGDLGGPVPEDAFIAVLEQAKSNDPDIGTGADVYRATAPPSPIS